MATARSLELETAFKRLCQSAGKRVAAGVGDVGGWFLFNDENGKWRIARYANKAGSMNFPMGVKTYSKGEMLTCLQFAEGVIDAV